MTYPTIRTVEELRSFLQLHASEGRTVDDAMLLWFTCVGYAKSLCDASIRDIARLFSDGVTPVKTLDDVQAYLDTFWEDEGMNEEQDAQLNLPIVLQVFQFFNKVDLIDEVEAMME